MSLVRTAAAFVRRDFLVETSYRVNFVLGIGSTIASLFFMKYISKFVGGFAGDFLEEYHGDYFAFLVLGIGMQSMLDTALGETSSRIRRSQVLGTLEALLATRTGMPVILFCMPIYASIDTFIRVSLYVVVGVTFFEMPIRFENLHLTAVVLILAFGAFASIGLVISALTVAFKRAGPVASLISGLCLFVGGVYYPVSVLPDWLGSIAFLLPITPALKALRLTFLSETAGWSEIAPHLATLALFIAIVLPLGIWVFRWSLRRAMRDGTLTQY